MIPEAISFGRAVVSMRLLILFLSIAGGLLLGWFALGSRRNDLRRLVVDAITNSVLLVIGGWKLTALFTQFGTIRREPLLLMYVSGGRMGFGIGILLAAAYLAWRFRPAKQVNVAPKDLIRAAALCVAASLAVYVVLFGSVAVSYAFSADGRPTAAVGRPAPDLSLSVLGATRDAHAETLSIGDLRGKPVLINFWATWCGPCRAETVVKNRLAEEFGDLIQLLGVNLTYTENSLEAVEAYAQEWRVVYPILLDIDGRAADRYAVRGTPTTIILGRDGTIHTRLFGPMSYDAAAAAIRSVLRDARPAAN